MWRHEAGKMALFLFALMLLLLFTIHTIQVEDAEAHPTIYIR